MTDYLEPGILLFNLTTYINTLVHMTQDVGVMQYNAAKF